MRLDKYLKVSRLIKLGSRTLAVEVLQVADAVRKDDAAGMYREV